MLNTYRAGDLSTYYSDICANYNNEISKLNDKESLKKLKFRVIETDKEIQQRITSIPRFSQRKLRDSISQVFKSIEAKESRLGVDRFVFSGAPMPPSAPKPKPTFTSEDSSMKPKPTIDALVKKKKTIIDPPHHILMNNVDSSIVISSSIVQSVHAEGISNSVVHVRSAGPVHLNHVSGSCVIVSCQQLRLHDVVDTSIFVDVTSNRVVTEGCSGIRFFKLSPNTEDFSLDNFDCPVPTEKCLTSEHDPNQGSGGHDYTWVFAIKDGTLSEEVCNRIKDISL